MNSYMDVLLLVHGFNHPPAYDCHDPRYVYKAVDNIFGNARFEFQKAGTFEISGMRC